MVNTIVVSNGAYLYANAGTEYLVSGGTTATYTSSVGDVVTVLAGGTISSGIVVSNGGSVVVQSGGVASGVTVDSGGKFVVSNGGSAVSAAVYSSGVMTAVGLSPAITGTTVYSGGLLDYATNKENSPSVSVTSGAYIEFAGLNASPTLYTTGETTAGLFSISAGTSASGTVQLATSTTYVVTSGYINLSKMEIEITCYAGGTKILTAQGEIPVETLKPSDSVMVRRDGQTVAEPVMWVGSSSVDLSRHAQPELAAPIRIKAGALAEAVPVRDLVVSPEHSLIIDGHCVPAKLLVNGGSIAREYPSTPFMYYHVELEKHGILIADGAEAESYLDTGNRSLFDNGGEPKMLHPSFELNADSARWQTDACAPLLSDTAAVASIWQGLADRSAALGFVTPEAMTVEDADLHLVADGKRISPVSDRDSRYVFAIPAGVQSVSLVSRHFIPADRMIAAERDTRCLGVQVDWIAIRAAGNETILTADHPALRDGWYATEKTPTAMYRWTNGAASIPWQDVQGSAMLTVRCTPASQYPVHHDAVQRAAA